jgi:hypothetical protein
VLLFDHNKAPLQLDAVNVTEPPSQKLVAPDTEIVGVKILEAFTIVATLVAEHPDAAVHKTT